MEVLLNNLASVDVLENTNLLPMLICLELNKLLSEDNFNSSLLALIESNFVSVAELIDLLIGGPDLNSGISSRPLVQLVMSQEMFVVKSIEIVPFSLVGEVGRIAEHVSVGMVPSVVEVLVDNS